MPKKVVGFIITPGEIKNRVDSLDRAIMALREAVRKTSAPRLNRKWKDAFEGFVTRWAVERDAWSSWDARLFATRVMPRLEEFEGSYRQWSAQFRDRTNGLAPIPERAPDDPLIPTGVSTGFWLLAGLGLYLVISQRAGRR